MQTVLVSVALACLVVSGALGECPEEADAVTGITWPSTADGATAQRPCPEIGNATRLCQDNSTWADAVHDGCHCGQSTVNAITWLETPNGASRTQACPSAGTASRLCNSTSLRWETPNVSGCRCAAGRSTLNWPETVPSNTPATISCPASPGNATRRCSPSTLNWEGGDSPWACYCAAFVDQYNLSWPVLNFAYWPQYARQVCPGGGGEAIYSCEVWTGARQTNVGACRCSAETDGTTGFDWAEMRPSNTPQAVACPTVGTAYRTCNTTTLRWGSPNYSNCQCGGALTESVNWPVTNPGENVTLNCPTSAGTGYGFCSPINYKWEGNFSECTCAAETLEGITFPTTAAGRSFALNCPKPFHGRINRVCSIATGSWAWPADSCHLSPAHSLFVSMSVPLLSFVIFVLSML